MHNPPPMPKVVFIFGALRSGTTLFRLMLNSHAGLQNPGEADFIFDYLRPDATHPTGWSYDKAAMTSHRIFRAHGLECPPGLDGLDLTQALVAQFQARGPGLLTLNIHRHAKRAATLFPEARFIHLLRDPRDVAHSSIGMGWAGNSFHGVGHWIETEQGWDEAAQTIDPKSILTLQFETLMGALEEELTRVCAFLRVPFSRDMLSYHEASTYGPPDPKIAQQWRTRATAREIALIEGRCVGLMQSRGYALHGTPATPGPVERFCLNQTNRFKRWRHNMRRFGVPLFFGAHAARIFGPKRLRVYFQKRLEAKVIENLK